MQILFVSLGCDKNLVDTEMMLGQLAEKGYTFTDDEAEADIAVVNSCCFIGDAKEESINTILQLAELKTEGQLKALIVCGCLAQRYKDEIQTEIPEVDAIIGTTAIDMIVETVDSVLAGKSENHLEDIDRACVYGVPRSVTTGGHFAYLKIAEGCNKRCTYCVIPSVRGNYRSIPMESLVREAKKLVENGAKELILVDFNEIHSDEEAKAVAREHHIEFEERHKKGDILSLFFEEYAEAHLIQPTFVMDHPVEISPLTKRKPENPDYVERFELFMNGWEMANAYSELNDPIDQRARFKAQEELLSQGDEEANTTDEDFMNALEIGMPPTGGIGFGIDRMVMLLTNSPAIRDVLLFPTMKSLEKKDQ